METSRATAVAGTASPRLIWLGVILVGLGLLGHLFAARAIGGSHLAYRDHIAGFFLILLVTGALIVGLGWRFWRGRHDITLLVIGAVQALFGLVIYIERFHVLNMVIAWSQFDVVLVPVAARVALLIAATPRPR